MKQSDSGPLLSANPVQLLYDLVPLPDTGSVLVIRSPSMSLFALEQTRFGNVTHKLMDFSDPQLRYQTIAELDFPEDKTFDLVVLHGVLDEMGASLPRTVSREWQATLMKNAFTSLNEKGVLAVVVDNKFAIADAMGYLRSLLGRMSRKQKSSHGERAWSYWSLKKYLETVGFRNLKIFNVLPHYQYPSRIVSTKLLPSKDYFTRESVRVSESSSAAKAYIYKLLAVTGMIRYFENCFLVWAEK